MSDVSEAPAVSEIERLSTRLDRIESELAIRTVCAEYIRGIDAREMDRVLAAWHEDATFDLGEYGACSGHEEIRKFFAEMMWPHHVETHHTQANFAIDVEGERATGHSDVAIQMVTSDGGLQVSAVTFEDVFERRDGVWKIARRVAHASPVRTVVVTA